MRIYCRLFLWVFILLALSACDFGEEGQGEGTSGSPVMVENLEDIREALQVNDFRTVDSLAAMAIDRARELDDRQSLVDATHYLVSSYIDRRRIREGERLVLENLERIEEFGTPDQHVRALLQLSNLRYLDNRDDEGGELLEQAMAMESRVTDARILGALYASRARAFTNKDPGESLSLYFDAIEKFEETGDHTNMAVAYNNIGLLYHNKGDYTDALEQYERALALNREVGNQLQVAANYNNIANSLSSLERKEAAADSLMKAILINQKMGISPSLIQNYYNLAQIYLEDGELDAAYSFFTQAYEESRSIDFRPGVMYHAAGLAHTLYEMERYDEVDPYLDEARRLAEQMNNLDVLARTWNIESMQSEDLGRYQQAITALRQEKKYSDRLDSIRRNREFEEIRSGLELELKTAENELLRQQLTYRERFSRNQQLILVLMVIGVLVIATLLFVLIRNKRKQENVNRSLKQKNSVITGKNRQLRHLNSELKYLNDEKTRLVGMIIHDLRNPLFAVIGFLELIDESLSEESEKEHLQMAMKSAGRLNQLINSLLEVHSLEKETRKMELTNIQVQELVLNAVTNFQEMARKKDINLNHECDALEADTDPDYLNRIVDNLVSNAIKYSPRHSKVKVEVNRKDNNRWLLAVDDEGPGISQEDQANLYQMFGRLSAKPTGGEESTGLGLYTVKMLVGRLKGNIRLESELGKGSRFICEFPIRPEMAIQDDGPEEPDNNIDPPAAPAGTHEEWVGSERLEA